MVVDPQRDVPAAPAGDQENTAAQGDPAPSPAPVTPAAPAATPAVESKAERDRRAAEGRRQAALERRLQETQQQVAQVAQQNAALMAHIQSTEQQRLRAQAESIEDPGERALALIRLQEQQQRTAGARPQPASAVQQPVAAAPSAEDIRRQGQGIIDQVNAELGTDLTVDEPDLDWEDPTPFRASAYRLAAQRVRTQGAVTPPATGGDVPAKKTEEDNSVEAITERVTAQVRREMGISSPASPQPVGSRAAAGVPTEEALQQTVSGYNSRLGPQATRKKLQEQREALAKAANVK